jgi:hypothetical protein
MTSTLIDTLLSAATADLLAGYHKATDERTQQKWLAAMYRVRAKNDPDWLWTSTIRWPRQTIALGPVIGRISGVANCLFPPAGEDWNYAVRQWCYSEYLFGTLPEGSEALAIAQKVDREVLARNAAEADRDLAERRRREREAPAKTPAPAATEQQSWSNNLF